MYVYIKRGNLDMLGVKQHAKSNRRNQCQNRTEIYLLLTGDPTAGQDPAEQTVMW